MGSYSSLGPVLAAKRLNIPVILHEANVIPGKAISLLSHFATAVAITFPETRDHIRHHNIVRVGLPLRKTMEDAAISTKASPTPFVVLTMGGSQGAQRLNEMVPKALGIIRQEGHSITAIHLAGEKSKEQVESAYREANVPATVHGFCSDMVSIYQNTSLAISRSGANSCLELALFGIPSILVPLPTSARDHQKANARAMEKAGAATLIEQAGLSPVLLAQTIRAIMTSPDTLERMRNHAKARASTGAAESLADLIVKVGGSR
jgi:UDP-N-acetylglucosamine--N-acetylmuramyl-(pentapeptide) pyrophosphoryl-undecaprenol N-acetylglucosamine transferase